MGTTKSGEPTSPAHLFPGEKGVFLDFFEHFQRKAPEEAPPGDGAGNQVGLLAVKELVVGHEQVALRRRVRRDRFAELDARPEHFNAVQAFLARQNDLAVDFFERNPLAVRASAQALEKQMVARLGQGFPLQQKPVLVDPLEGVASDRGDQGAVPQHQAGCVGPALGLVGRQRVLQRTASALEFVELHFAGGNAVFGRDADAWG